MDVTSDSGIFFTKPQCVVINQEPFWEIGYSAEKLFDHLMANFQFKLDGQAVPESETENMWRPMAYPVRDSEGNVLGLYGGPITLCMNTAGLEVGLHVAAIQIVGVSGETRTYEWAFQQPEAPQTEEQPTLAILPTLPASSQ